MWLHHDERRDAGCCHTCLKAIQNAMLTSSNADPVFTKNGFSNWKNATEKKKGFQKDESSDSDMEVATKSRHPQPSNGWYWWFAIWTTCIGKGKNRKILLSILSNIWYLARQAFLSRGDWKTETMSEELNVLWFQLWQPSHWIPCCLSRTGCLRWMQLSSPIDSIFDY